MTARARERTSLAVSSVWRSSVASAAHVKSRSKKRHSLRFLASTSFYAYKFYCLGDGVVASWEARVGGAHHGTELRDRSRDSRPGLLQDPQRGRQERGSPCSPCLDPFPLLLSFVLSLFYLFNYSNVVFGNYSIIPHFTFTSSIFASFLTFLSSRAAKSRRKTWRISSLSSKPSRLSTRVFSKNLRIALTVGSSLDKALPFFPHLHSLFWLLPNFSFLNIDYSLFIRFSWLLCKGRNDYCLLTHAVSESWRSL